MLKTSSAAMASVLDHDPFRPGRHVDSNGQLACSLAHDLNNVLQIISGNLAMLSRETTSDGVASRRIASAMAAVALGASLTRKVLDHRDLGEPGAAHIDLRTACLDVLCLIEDATGPDVDVRFDIDPNIHTVAVDGAALGHALLNLAINGRDAMNGRGLLSIAIENCPDGGIGIDAAVLVSVTDEGCGMAASIVERAFEPFMTTKPAGVGTGLGLSGVQDFATQAGATIVVESSPGEGTTIRLRLPCKSARATLRPPSPTGT